MPTAIADVLQDLRQGRLVILTDDEDRENEGDLLMAAQHVTPAAINFMITHGRGLICLTLTEERCSELGLPLMAQRGASRHGTAFTVSIEAAKGVSTGISAHDRAHTISVAVNPRSRPEDLLQPGHVFPLMARKGGVLVRAGHTEAGCDLTRLAGLMPAAVICEILKEDGSMARASDLAVFARQHQLRIGTIAELIGYRIASEQLVEKVRHRRINSPFGLLHLHAFRDHTSGEIHLALVLGDVRSDRDTLVRVQDAATHYEMMSLWQPKRRPSLHQCLQHMADCGSGVLVLLQRTSQPDELLSLLHDDEKENAPRWDSRLHGIGAQILRLLGVGRMKLLSSPVRMPSLVGFGLEVTGFVPTGDNQDT